MASATEHRFIPSNFTANSIHYTDTIAVTVSLPDAQPTERYQVWFECSYDAPQYWFGKVTGYKTTKSSEFDYIGNALNPLTLIAVQDDAFAGNFTIDFMPISIVYCPPGQDMTNSLTQSSSFGTRISLGAASGMEADTTVQFALSFLGMLGAGFDSASSKSVSNQSSSGTQLSHFRNTVVTADNQKAIGRAYWGPLGDIFIIAVSPKFAVSKRAKGTLFYSLTDIKQVVFIPAWKLLRPLNDPIASAIPAAARQNILGLDPFITNLALFFPDSGADLSKAADPHADPSKNNRAELIGRWWIDAGAELSYSMGDQIQLTDTQTNQVNYGATATISANAGVDYDGIKVGLGLGLKDAITLAYQASKSTDASYTLSVGCLLLRNQNERDLDGIDVYFDKVFSTLMFRRIRSQPRAQTKGKVGKIPVVEPPVPIPIPIPPGPFESRGYGAIVGTITNPDGLRLRGLQVYADGPGKVRLQTSTRTTGQYGFYNLAVGRYVLTAGDRRARVDVGEGCSPQSPQNVDLTGVRRYLDLSVAPVWEVVEALELSFDVVNQIARNLSQITDERSLARVCGVGDTHLQRWRRMVVFAWGQDPTLRQGPGGRPSRARKYAKGRKRHGGSRQ